MAQRSVGANNLLDIVTTTSQSKQPLTTHGDGDPIHRAEPSVHTEHGVLNHGAQREAAEADGEEAGDVSVQLVLDLFIRFIGLWTEGFQQRVRYYFYTKSLRENEEKREK
jgi:hypothetical protein